MSSDANISQEEMESLIHVRKPKVKSDAVSVEIIEAAKKISKTERKRLDQIRLRKEKEEKRDQYLRLLNEHVMSDSHRQLLTSSQNIGQTATLKGALKKALKRHQAGLSITNEEHELLFPENRQQLELSSDLGGTILPYKSRGVEVEELAFLRGELTKKEETVLDPRFVMEAKDVAPEECVNATESGIENADLKNTDLFDFDEEPIPTVRAATKSKRKMGALMSDKVLEESSATVTQAYDITEDQSTSKKLKGKKAKKGTEGSLPTAEIAPPVTVPLGLSLKQQLERFKQKVASGDKSSVIHRKEIIPTEEPSSEVIETVGTSVSAKEVEEELVVYKPVSISEPVGPDGRVLKAILTEEEMKNIEDGVGGATKSSTVLLKNSSYLKRDPRIQAARLNLPVCGMEQEIVEAITLNDVVILCGETGSGKSTQVPQFLYEAGYGDSGMIGITQPRRVAATSTAERVGVEMGELITSIIKPKNSAAQKKNKKKQKSGGSGGDAETETEVEVEVQSSVKQGGLVGYQIRFDASTVGEKTKIKFMTDGILLREVTSDLLLRQYSVILLDEAHERNVNTDILLGMISRSLPLRRAQSIAESAKWSKIPLSERAQYSDPLKPLKLVIMSATMRVEDFRNPRLFPSPPPIIKVDARQYPVTVHFSKKTEIAHYLNETYKKICQIHRRLPDGGILVFLTGKREIMYMCRKINKALNGKKRASMSLQHDSTESTLADDDVSADASRKGEGEGEGEGKGSGKGGMKGSKKRGRSNEEEEDISADTSANGYAVGSSSGQGGMLRGMDDDEIEGEEDGGGVEGQDDDLFSMGDGGDGDGEGEGDYESDEDGDGYDSLGEEEIMREERAKVSAAALLKKSTHSVAGTGAGAGEAGDVDGDAERLRSKMLREVLGLPEPDSESLKADNGPPGSDQTGSGSGPELGATDDNSHGMGGSCPRVLVLPLFAMMTAEQQSKVFKDAPKGHRMIIIATNVAETSITIPGIRYVVDSGRQKERVQNLSSGVSKFEVKWVAQASAEQRKGRAGRTGPGHCYRLYSSAFYDQHMVPFQPPEIATTPLEDLLLQMRSLGISEVENFPFPTAPPQASLERALDLLVNLGAITPPQRIQNLDVAAMAIASAASSSSSRGAKQSEQLKLQLQAQQQLMANKRMSGGKLTDLGKLLAMFPINPRFAKMLVVAFRSGVLSHALSLVAILAERSPYEVLTGSKKGKSKGKGNSKGKSPDDFSDVDEDEDKEEDEEEGEEEEVGSSLGSLWPHTEGDALSRLRAMGAFAYTANQVALKETARRAARVARWAKEALDREKEKEKEKESSVRDTESGAGAGGKKGKNKKGKEAVKGTGMEKGLVSESGAKKGGAVESNCNVDKDKEEEKEKEKKETKGQRFRRIESEKQAKRDAIREEQGEALDELQALCVSQSMHKITLQRALDLRGQLVRSCASVFVPLQELEEQNNSQQKKAGGKDEATEKERLQAFSKSLIDGCSSPPTAAEEMALRQVLLTGYCDSVARRAPLGTVKTGGRHRRLTAYISCSSSISQPLYIHPHSVLYRRDPSAPLPEYVVYGPLITNQRGDTTYMTCVSVVTPAWIPMLARDSPLLHWSEPLTTPPPFFDADADSVSCYVIPKYGAHNWELAPVKRLLQDCLVPPSVTESGPQGFRKADEPYRWFARLLLEGSVLPELRSVLRRDRLKDAPSLLTQMKPSTKVFNLLRALVSAKVQSRAALLVKLKTTPDFLSEEMQQFLVIEARKDFRRVWGDLRSSQI